MTPPFGGGQGSGGVKKRGRSLSRPPRFLCVKQVERNTGEIGSQKSGVVFGELGFGEVAGGNGKNTGVDGLSALDVGGGVTDDKNFG